MKEITLSQNKVSLVDDEDYDFLNQWKWCTRKKKLGKFYAVRNLPRDPITHQQKQILMHQVIMNAPDYAEVDHEDNDGLNNQKYNLRIATKNQNQHNGSKRVDNTSGYKGVSWYNQTTKWQVKIAFNGKLIHLGYFDDPIQAAKAYDRKAVEIFGEFAKLNFPSKG
jgi:hypothetical protein